MKIKIWTFEWEIDMALVAMVVLVIAIMSIFLIVVAQLPTPARAQGFSRDLQSRLQEATEIAVYEFRDCGTYNQCPTDIAQGPVASVGSDYVCVNQGSFDRCFPFSQVLYVDVKPTKADAR